VTNEGWAGGFADYWRHWRYRYRWVSEKLFAKFM